MPNVVVAENHLTFGGISYFRGGAELVEIGSIGEKRTPLTKQNYLEVKDRIPVPTLAVARATVAEIDFSKTTKSAFKTVVSAIMQGVPVNFSGGATFDKLKTGELKLVEFSIANNDLEVAANKAGRKLQDLIDWGDDARIVNRVFIVMQAEFARHFDNGAKADLSIGVKGLQAKVGGSSSSSGETVVQIARGSCFAYLMVKMDWDAKQKKNKTKIVDLDDDQWSFS